MATPVLQGRKLNCKINNIKLSLNTMWEIKKTKTPQNLSFSAKTILKTMYMKTENRCDGN